MQIYPTLEEVRKISAEGKYDVVPLSCEILSDFTTPIETMKILKSVSTHCYMLESAQANDRWGRYTFMGYDPKMDRISAADPLLLQKPENTKPAAVHGRTCGLLLLRLSRLQRTDGKVRR